VNLELCRFRGPEPLLHTQGEAPATSHKSRHPLVWWCQHLTSLESRRANLGNFLPSCKEVLTRKETKWSLNRSY